MEANRSNAGTDTFLMIHNESLGPVVATPLTKLASKTGTVTVSLQMGQGAGYSTVTATLPEGLKFVTMYLTDWEARLFQNVNPTPVHGLSIGVDFSTYDERTGAFMGRIRVSFPPGSPAPGWFFAAKYTILGIG